MTVGNNVRANSALVSTTSSTFLTGSINSLTFESGGGLTLNAYRNFTNASGGILAKSSASMIGLGAGIGAAAMSGASNAELIIHVYGSGSTLTSSVAFGGAVAPSTGGFTKTGNGKLVLDSAIGNSYSGTSTLQLGILQFGTNGPASNALFYKFGTASGINGSGSTQNADALVVNSGATLDLNGRGQVFGDMLSRGSLPGSGGIITNSASGDAVGFVTTVGSARLRRPAQREPQFRQDGHRPAHPQGQQPAHG